MRRMRAAGRTWIFLAGIGLAAGCAPGGGPGTVADFGTTRPPGDNIFRFNNAAEPEGIDPGLISGQPDGRVARILFEGLAGPDSATLEPRPAQARSWDISPDGLRYVFHLRPGLTWTDGAALTARDFQYAWMRVLRPATNARYASALFPIRNAEAFNKGELADSSQVGIQAPDDTTLVVTLEHPTPYFLFLTMFYTYLPVPRQAVERWGDAWVKPGRIVTNGAFALKSWRAGDRFVFTKNPRYWDAARVRLDGIECYPIDDVNTAVNMYKAGQIDWNPSGSTPTPFLPYLRKFKDLRSGPFQAVYFYGINTTRKPLDDPRVRLALNFAVDRAAIADKLLQGTRPPWGLLCPRGYPGYTPPSGYTYDPDRARRLLAEAGFPGGKGFRKIEILINTSEDHKRLAEAIQGMWTRELHIPVGITSMEWGSYLEASTSLKYDVARRSWIGDFLDPTTFLTIMRSGDGNNRTGWSDKGYDALLDAAGAEPDAARRMQMLHDAEARIVDHGSVIPIYHYQTYSLVKPYLRGMEETLLDVHPLQRVWLDRGTARQ